MADFMINHISAQSMQFQDYLQNGDQSPYRDMFIRYADFWENGEPTPAELESLYKLKVKGPELIVRFADGTQKKIWSTFSPEQIDIDVTQKISKDFFARNLKFLAEKGFSFIRLDAFAYATKKRGTNCFFVEPETWDLLAECKDIVAPYQSDVLPEIHENYLIQTKVSEHGYWVYDFALPMLMLHALITGRSDRLLHWLKICPRKQFTTLDTHDGIGVVDVRYLLEESEIDEVNAFLKEQGADENSRYRDPKVYSRSTYQQNCTYYSALGCDDNAYLTARAIQFFAPGTPMVYYVGMLAGKNDLDLMNRTKVPRDVNRHYYTEEELKTEVERPVVKRLGELMRFRNEYPAFNGDMLLSENAPDGVIEITWTNGELSTTLQANLQKKSFVIRYLDPHTREEKIL